MISINPVTPTIGAELSGIDFSSPVDASVYDEIYEALIQHLVIFIHGVDISPQHHLELAKNFGELDDPHPLYPHVDGYENILQFENDENNPPDTNSWHTDLTFKEVQPFASILIARQVPPSGGDTMWSSCYAAYDRLSDGMKWDLEKLQAVHDFGDFRNSFAVDKDGKSARERLEEGIAQFGQNVRPLIGTHPVTGRKFLNFNEAFVSHILGLTTSKASSLKTFLVNHMNTPEDQVRWRWTDGDLAMWDNRVTTHYALADYMPHYRCMNRVTVVHDRRAENRDGEP